MPSGDTPETPSYPWSVLGLDGPGDISAIRRAYARKLKETRPDEDPKGFQALVQAREEALETAASAVAPHEAPPLEDAGVQAALIMDAAPAATEKLEDPVAEPERREKKAKCPPVTVALSPEDFPPASDEHPKSAIVIKASPPPSPPPALLIRQAIAAHPGCEEIVQWHTILILVADLPLAERPAVEPLIIQELYRAAETFLPTESEWNRLEQERHQIDRRALIIAFNNKAFRQHAIFGDIVLAFSEEFGWNTNDQIVERVLGRRTIRAFRFNEWLKGLQWQEPPSMQPREGDPVMGIGKDDIADLEDALIEQAFQKLEKRRRTGLWPLDFWLFGALMAGPYLSSYFRRRITAAWLACILFGMVTSHVLAPRLPSLAENIIRLEAWLPLAGFHGWLLLWGYRGILRSAADLFARADSLGLHNRLLRKQYFHTFTAFRISNSYFGYFFYLIATLSVLIYI